MYIYTNSLRLLVISNVRYVTTSTKIVTVHLWVRADEKYIAVVVNVRRYIYVAVLALQE